MTEWLEIPELGIKVSQIKGWNKPYNEILIPEGCKLIEIWQLAYILESKYSDKFLGKYKDKYNYFWCNQTKYAKKNNYASRLVRDRGGDWYGGNWNYYLADSFSVGRVVLVSDLKVKK